MKVKLLGFYVSIKLNKIANDHNIMLSTIIPLCLLWHNWNFTWFIRAKFSLYIETTNLNHWIKFKRVINYIKRRINVSYGKENITCNTWDLRLQNILKVWFICFINDNQNRLTSDFIALEDNMHNQIGHHYVFFWTQIISSFTRLCPEYIN